MDIDTQTFIDNILDRMPLDKTLSALMELEAGVQRDV